MERVLDPLLLIGSAADSAAPMAQVTLGDAPAGLLPARQQMALSLGWHTILACFGVAFPAMITPFFLGAVAGAPPRVARLASD
ncbi:hypothetical protein GCM10027062_31960 [Nocardioides hungaricus]